MRTLDVPTNHLIPTGGATFSPCGLYRYDLWRRWDFSDAARMLCWVMLNPSEATDIDNDPTIRRCIDFAQRWTFGGMHVVNLFAFRSPHPKAMKAAADPIGPDNDAMIRSVAEQCQDIVAAWGNHGTYKTRGAKVVATILNQRTLWCLGTNDNFQPVHPLFVPANRHLQLLRWADPTQWSITRK